MLVYKKNVLKKQEKNKFIYKYKYSANFLSRQKQNINDVDLYKLNLLAYNEKVPLINKHTGKFLFKKKIVGNINFGNFNRVLINKTLNAGDLVLGNNNKIWNPKLSKVKIKTKSAITSNDKNKQFKIGQAIYLRKIFSVLKTEVLDSVKISNFFKDNKIFRNLYYRYLQQRRIDQQIYDKLALQRIKRSLKKNEGKSTAESDKQQRLFSKRMFFDKKKHKESFISSVDTFFEKESNNDQSFKLTIAQMITSNVYLGTNNQYISSAVKPFLLGKRNGFYIINLSFTYLQFKVLINFILNIVSLRRKILIVKEYDMFNLNLLVNYTNIFYYDKKWIGGVLTNHKIVRLCDKFKQRNYAENSLLNMKQIPSLLFLFDPNVSMSALFEGFNLKIPIAGIVNTNCLFFESINYPIIGNNDSFESTYLYMYVLKNAVKMGIQKEYIKVLKII